MFFCWLFWFWGLFGLFGCGFFLNSTCQESLSGAICNFMTVQKSFYSLGEIAQEIVTSCTRLSFQLHEITPAACEEINIQAVWGDNLI